MVRSEDAFAETFHAYQGINMKKYVFRKYGTIYASFFKVEKRRLMTALGKVEIIHIGSTAVPGLGGKNFVDAMVGVKTGRLNKLKEPLKKLGYEYGSRGGNARRLYFGRNFLYRHKLIRMHVHVVRFNGLDWRKKIAFRDYLIRNRPAMLEYADVKRKAAKLAGGDKAIYTSTKEKFIKRATKMALKGNR